MTSWASIDNQDVEDFKNQVVDAFVSSILSCKNVFLTFNWWRHYDLDKVTLSVIWIMGGLATRLKVSRKSIPFCWLAPLPTNRDFYLSKNPSHLFLFLKIYKIQIILALGGQGTESPILFSIRSTYSSFMSIF